MASFELDDELIGEFVLEARETIDEVEASLIDLERARSEGADPDPEEINRLFRAFHSIKGSAGFLEMDRLVQVTHAGETLLDLVRGGKLTLGEAQVDALCDALDFSRAAVDLLEKKADQSTLDPDPVITLLTAATQSEPDPPSRDAPVEVEPEVEAEPDMPAEAPIFELPEPVAHIQAASPEPATAARSPAEPHTPAKTPSSSGPSHGEKTRQKSIRVDVDKLEALMNLVGELILAETSVTHHEAAEILLEDDSYRRAVLRLNRVSRSLQDIAMSLRMVPVEATFKRLQRLVRDLARKQDKEVALQLTGLDTEVDKNLIEAIGDPLVHIIRNSIDHGLEGPEDRTSNGKPAEGTVSVDACHRAGEVWITIRDDGRGLNADRIRQIAIERGVIAPEAELDLSQIHALIFEPGFSTAETVTDVSGRGVGMDVVRRNIQSLNGYIEVESEPGQGTLVRLRIPLTLAIIEGMLVRIGTMRYTIPLLSIRESVPLQAGLIQTLPGGRRIARIRGEIVPVTGGSLVPHTTSRPDEGILIMLEHGGRPFGFVVDELLGQRQTVVKGLPSYLAGHPGLAGCSLLPNGDITLILDVAALRNSTPRPGLSLAESAA